MAMMEVSSDLSDLEMVTPMMAARLLGIGRTTIYRMLSEGELPGVRFGKTWRLPVVELRRHLAEQGIRGCGEDDGEDAQTCRNGRADPKAEGEGFLHLLHCDGMPLHDRGLGMGVRRP